MSLVCPGCGRVHPDDERFCAGCGLPLVAEGGPAEAEVTERQARLRKVKAQYAEGELVRVAVSRQQVDAEFMQNLLLEEGVPSTLRRTRGFDLPLLTAGPRDILVPQSGEEVAREVLHQARVEPAGPGRGPVAPGRLLAGLLGSVGLVAAITFLADALGA